ncbi:MAG: hypothetical protein KDC92_05995, partial [Bacteroidetes bacterium]|nr:hypothetical protein [Bacteroidota bacterium]
MKQYLILLLALFGSRFLTGQTNVQIPTSAGNRTSIDHLVAQANYHLTGLVYESSEIGMEGIISSLSFYCKDDRVVDDIPIKIYMAQVDSSIDDLGYSADFYKLSKGSILVYDDSLYKSQVKKDTWITIYLKNNFNYERSKNLVIYFVIADNNPTETSARKSFRAHSLSKRKAFVYRGSSPPTSNYLKGLGTRSDRLDIKLSILSNSGLIDLSLDSLSLPNINGAFPDSSERLNASISKIWSDTLVFNDTVAFKVNLLRNRIVDSVFTKRVFIDTIFPGVGQTINIGALNLYIEGEYEYLVELQTAKDSFVLNNAKNGELETYYIDLPYIGASLLEEKYYTRINVEYNEIKNEFDFLSNYMNNGKDLAELESPTVKPIGLNDELVIKFDLGKSYNDEILPDYKLKIYAQTENSSNWQLLDSIYSPYNSRHFYSNNKHISLSQFEGKRIRFKIVGKGKSRQWWRIPYIGIKPQCNVDFAAFKVHVDDDGKDHHQSKIWLKAFYQGADSVNLLTDSIPVRFKIESENSNHDTLIFHRSNKVLKYGDTIKIELTNSRFLLNRGKYLVKASILHPNDANGNNNTETGYFFNKLATGVMHRYYTDFEESDFTSAKDFTVEEEVKVTNYYGGGVFDSKYTRFTIDRYVEYVNGPMVAALDSNAILHFQYRLNNTTTIAISTNNGKSYDIIDSILNTNGKWRSYYFDLSNYSGQNVVFQFRRKYATINDLDIDNFGVGSFSKREIALAEVYEISSSDCYVNGDVKIKIKNLSPFDIDLASTPIYYSLKYSNDSSVEIIDSLTQGKLLESSSKDFALFSGIDLGSGERIKVAVKIWVKDEIEKKDNVGSGYFIPSSITSPAQYKFYNDRRSWTGGDIKWYVDGIIEGFGKLSTQGIYSPLISNIKPNTTATFDIAIVEGKNWYKKLIRPLTSDSVRLEISTDCGSSYQILQAVSAMELPNINGVRVFSVDLSKYANQTIKLKLRLTRTSSTSNKVGVLKAFSIKQRNLHEGNVTLQSNWSCSKGQDSLSLIIFNDKKDTQFFSKRSFLIELNGNDFSSKYKKRIQLDTLNPGDSVLFFLGYISNLEKSNSFSARIIDSIFGSYIIDLGNYQKVMYPTFDVDFRNDHRWDLSDFHYYNGSNGLGDELEFEFKNYSKGMATTQSWPISFRNDSTY